MRVFIHFFVLLLTSSFTVKSQFLNEAALYWPSSFKWMRRNVVGVPEWAGSMTCILKQVEGKVLGEGDTSGRVCVSGWGWYCLTNDSCCFLLVIGVSWDGCDVSGWGRVMDELCVTPLRYWWWWWVVNTGLRASDKACKLRGNCWDGLVTFIVLGFNATYEALKTSLSRWLVMA